MDSSYEPETPIYIGAPQLVNTSLIANGSMGKPMLVVVCCKS